VTPAAETLPRGLVVFKALSDHSRLRIVTALRERALYVELISERLKLSPSTVSFHLKKLEEAGLVRSTREQYYVVYSLVDSMMERPIGSFLEVSSREARNQTSREDAYRRKVLNNFFAYGRLSSIPVQRKKRRIVLEHLVDGFETNRDYTEKEVNLILAEYNEDFCTLRREFICEKLMRRKGGIYRRITG